MLLSGLASLFHGPPLQYSCTTTNTFRPSQLYKPSQRNTSIHNTTPMASNCVHTRSISLTSSPHPAVHGLEEELTRFASHEATSFSFSLGGLKDLYDRVEQVLQLSFVQHALSNSEMAGEAVLEGSLVLLDTCGTAREVVSQVKQCLQDLASSFRRKKGDLAREVGDYMRCRRKLNGKCLARLRRKEAVKSCCAVEEARLVREAERVGRSVMEALLSSVARVPRSQGAWTVVSRLVKGRRGGGSSVLERLDWELAAMCGGGGGNVVKLMEEAEMGVRELEEELECVYRCLVRTRVALLNIFNH